MVTTPGAKSTTPPWSCSIPTGRLQLAAAPNSPSINGLQRESCQLKTALDPARVAAFAAQAHLRVDETGNQCGYLRHIVGNPFHPIAVNPSWLSSTVISLTEAIYEERAFERMPILADALEDAGCAHQDILDHCRAGGEHCRGCWVVDLALGKS